MVKLIHAEAKGILDVLVKEEKVRKSLNSLKEHHAETYRHSCRVGLLSIDLGYDNHVTEYELRLLGYSGLLHDIGKIRVPKEILSKKSSLNTAERNTLGEHSRLGFLEVGSLGYGRARQIVVAHHEYKAIPYPRSNENPCKIMHSSKDRRQIKEKISMLAQIVAVADIYDALTSSRSYKKPLPKGEINEILGNQFKGDGKYIEQVLQR